MTRVFVNGRIAVRFAAVIALGVVIAGSAAVARAQAPAPPPGPPPLTAALGARLARAAATVGECTTSRVDPAGHSGAGAHRIADAYGAHLQWQLLYRGFWYGMGQYRAGPELYRGPRSCHERLPGLPHEYCAIAIHSARAISGASRSRVHPRPLGT